MKKIINLKNISLFISVLMLISLIVLMININILPLRYIVGLSVIILLIFGIFLTLILKFNKKKIVMIIINIISILIISISIFGVSKIVQTNVFLLKNSKIGDEIINYYVVVNNKSSYKKLKNINNKDIKYKNDDTVSDALKKLNEKVNVNEKEYEDILELMNSVINNIDDVIFISQSDYEFLSEINSNYESNTIILEVVSLKEKNNYKAKSVKVTEEPFNVYISGIDTYGKISTRSRSDVNIIMTVDPKKKKILLTSIPRDYYVQLNGTHGLKDKLTHAGVYGIDKSVKTVEDLLDIEINYYLRVNFNTLIKVVDEIGGIEIDSDKAFTPHTNKKCYIEYGKQTLDGTCALAYSRERYAYKTGDRHRGQNQQEVIGAIIDKATSSKKVITNYSDVLNALDGAYQTSMTKDEIYSLIKLQVGNNSKWNIENISLNGFDASEYTYSYGSQKLYVMVPDQKTVEKAKEKIKEIIE